MKTNLNSMQKKSRLKLGFSLMEVLLVVTILVAVGALAAPTVLQTFSRQTLDKGADKVRVAMGQARVRAIRHGDVYAVFVMEGGAWFTVAPFTQARALASYASQKQQLATARVQSEFEDDLLPRGIAFAGNVVDNDSRAQEVLSVGGSDNFLRPILFYPDGTSQDAKVMLRNEKGATVEVQLRGLTGLASVVRTMEGNR